MNKTTKSALSIAKARGILNGVVRAEAPNALSVEVRAQVVALNTAFEAFREANDLRLDQIEAAGSADVVTAEKVDKINADVTAMQTSLDAALADLTAANIGGPSAEADRAIFALQANQFFSGLKGVENMPAADVDAYSNYIPAFASWLQGGSVALDRDPELKAAMQVGSDPDGGYWVPTQQMTNIITKLRETSPMRSVASVMSIPTDSVTWPNDTNDISTGGWVGETEARAETGTPAVGDQTIYVREQYAEPRVTQKLLDMATIDVESWLNGKIADKFSRVENTAFVSGTGVTQPRGFLDYKAAAVTTADDARAWGVLQYLFSGASGGFPTMSGSTASDPDKIWDVIAALNPAYLAGATWMMSRATQAAIRKLKDSQGNYFIGPIQNPAVGFELGGYGITAAEDMPALASDSFSAAFGDFRQGYQIVDGRGIRILRDPYTLKGKVKLYTTKWTGGDVLNFDAIKLLKFGTA